MAKQNTEKVAETPDVKPVRDAFDKLVKTPEPDSQEARAIATGTPTGADQVDTLGVAALEADRAELRARQEREMLVKEATEQMADEPGFPARTADGIVMIRQKRPAAADGGGIILIGADGTEYVDRGLGGALEPLQA